MKTCSKCNLPKDLDCFSKRKEGKDGYRNWCKSCANENSKSWLKDNPEKAKEIAATSHQNNKAKRKAYAKQWVILNPEKLRERQLQRNYSISLDDYKELLEQQEHRCAICKDHESLFNRPLYVDHCHKTGKVRGLLCPPCNKGIGFLKDMAKRCLEAYQYLAKFEADDPQ